MLSSVEIVVLICWNLYSGDKLADKEFALAAFGEVSRPSTLSQIVLCHITLSLY
jgi:hypothetical protein